MLQNPIISRAILLLTAALLIQCSEDPAGDTQTEKFTSIYDNRNFNATYVPIDVQQTPDGGYLVLSARKLTSSDYSGIHLLKADASGNFVREMEVGDSLTNPVARLTLINDRLYFFCMSTNTSALLASVDQNLDGLATTSAGGLTYPAATLYSDNFFYVLSYNNESKQSVISRVGLDGSSASKGYTIGVGDDVEEPVMNHFLHNGKHFPFDIGKISANLYYFNGFFDHTFSLVFTDMNADAPLGVVAGQHDDGGFSAVAHLSGSNFATARFNFGDNFLLPRTALSMSGPSSSTNLQDHALPELVPNAKVKILRTTINDKNVIIYASDTKSGQIGLFFYDEATGEFLSARYLGFANPFEIGNFISTTDGGLAVCGTTYLSGRFPRICIIKLSKEDVAGNLE